MSIKGSSTSTADIIEEPDEVSVKELTATMDGAKEIFYKLRESSVSKVVLVGETGTGKTWIARKVCEFIAKENHHEPIWISQDKRLDENSLKETVARQFSIPTFTYEGDGQVKIEKKETIKHKMIEKLKAAKRAKEFILLVLDGQLDMMEMKMQMGIEDYIKENILGLKDGDGMQYEDTLKVLITRRKSEVGDCATGITKFKLEPFSGDDASYLLRKEVVWKVSYSHPQAFEKVCEAFQQRSRKPARTFNYFAKDKYAELEPALEIAASSLTELWRYAYDKEPGDSMINCFWHSWNFLGKHGGVHYNELITSWMMEGCLKLDHTNQIEKAYEEGHHVLMKLIEYEMLEIQEDNNIIVLGGEAHELDKYCRRGYWGTSATGLASILKDIDGTGPDGIPAAKVLEEITPADGMMKTLCSDGKEETVSSLLIDGSRLCREVHDTFFGAKPNLKLLAIFSPLLRSPEELSMTKLENLRVLILKDSFLLENVNLVEKLRALTVLEISGSINLKGDFPELLDQVCQLRSLNLSGAGITSLPNLSNLTELRRIILNGCSSLEELPRLLRCIKLEVIDLSECTSFKKFQEKSFKPFTNLQVINFSHTKIEKLPILQTLPHLTTLLLKGCSALSKMRFLKRVPSLKVLDLSGATNINALMHDLFDGTYGLKELDLSETTIRFLPELSDINIQKLRLRGCSLLEKPPELGGNTILEELDLSGCEKLRNLPGLSNHKKLKILNLRGSKLWSKELVESLSHIKDLEIIS